MGWLVKAYTQTQRCGEALRPLTAKRCTLGLYARRKLVGRDRLQTHQETTTESKRPIRHATPEKKPTADETTKRLRARHCMSHSRQRERVHGRRANLDSTRLCESAPRTKSKRRNLDSWPPCEPRLMPSASQLPSAASTLGSDPNGRLFACA